MNNKLIFLFLVVGYVGCSGSYVNAKSSDISELSDSMRNLTGRVEELEKKLTELQNKFASFEKCNEESLDIKKEVSMIVNKTPDEILQQAKDMIEENNFEGARKLLKAFIDSHPGNVYLGQMHFYLGLSFFMEKRYEDAAIEFMKGFKANPHGSKSAETLYKLALCFKNMKESQKYKQTLEKLVKDYPGEFANKASRELKAKK